MEQNNNSNNTTACFSLDESLKAQGVTDEEQRRIEKNRCYTLLNTFPHLSARNYVAKQG